MIILHHLGRPHNAFALNRDLIVSVEARPDTVITLTSGDKLLVRESPEEVVELFRQGRADILAHAMSPRPYERAQRPPGRHHSDAPLTVIKPNHRPAGQRAT